MSTERFEAASTSLRRRAARLISHPALGPLECTACLYICVIMGSDVGRLGLQVRVYWSWAKTGDDKLETRLTLSSAAAEQVGGLPHRGAGT